MAFPRLILWILCWQLGVTLCFAGLVGVVEGRHALFSALCGGGIAVLANAGFAWQATRKGQEDGAKKVYRAQLRAEMLKWLLTVILFTLVFANYREVVGLPLFVAYMSTYAVFWVALLRKE